MDEYIIKLNAEDRKNLMVFLSRVELKGSEALAFTAIISKINQAEKKKDGE